MPRQVALRLFLVFALLLAQQTALTHQLFHVATAQASEKTPAPKGDRLCDLHDLLGTVLGVVSGPAPSHELPSLAEARSIATATAAPQASPLAPKSRGPPSIS